MKTRAARTMMAARPREARSARSMETFTSLLLFFQGENRFHLASQRPRQLEREQRRRDEDSVLHRIDRLAAHPDPVGKHGLGKIMLDPQLAQPGDQSFRHVLNPSA